MTGRFGGLGVIWLRSALLVAVARAYVGAMRAQLGTIWRVYDTEPTEVLGSILLVGMGLALLGPGSLFATSNSFAILARLLSENVWGLLLLLIGLARLVVIASGNARLRTTWSTASMILFLFMTGAIGAINPFGFGVATFGTMALASFWVSARLWNDRVR